VRSAPWPLRWLPAAVGPGPSLRGCAVGAFAPGPPRCCRAGVSASVRLLGVCRGWCFGFWGRVRSWGRCGSPAVLRRAGFGGPSLAAGLLRLGCLCRVLVLAGCVWVRSPVVCVAPCAVGVRCRRSWSVLVGLRAGVLAVGVASWLGRWWGSAARGRWPRPGRAWWPLWWPPSWLLAARLRLACAGVLGRWCSGLVLPRVCSPRLPALVASSAGPLPSSALPRPSPSLWSAPARSVCVPPLPPPRASAAAARGLGPRPLWGGGWACPWWFSGALLAPRPCPPGGAAPGSPPRLPGPGRPASGLSPLLLLLPRACLVSRPLRCVAPFSCPRSALALAFFVFPRAVSACLLCVSAFFAVSPPGRFFVPTLCLGFFCGVLAGVLLRAYPVPRLFLRCPRWRLLRAYPVPRRFLRCPRLAVSSCLLCASMFFARRKEGAADGDRAGARRFLPSA
jgi:hypothetical protein